MRHQRRRHRIQRKLPHRRSVISNQVCGLIEHRRIKTTLAKAKAVQPHAEKIIKLGKRGDLVSRRRAIAFLGNNKRAQRLTRVLFNEIAPASADRQGGYTRLLHLGPRNSDAAPMALLEWVDYEYELPIDNELDDEEIEDEG